MNKEILEVLKGAFLVGAMLALIATLLMFIGWLAASFIAWEFQGLYSWESFRGLIAILFLGGSGAAASNQ